MAHHSSGDLRSGRHNSPSWPELLALTEPIAVEPVRRLREGARGEMAQYFDFNGERLAIHDARAYGNLSGTSHPELMRTVVTRSDYSIFEVPEDTLSLKAITLGTGRQSTELLLRTYQRVGEALGRMISDVRTPLLSVADFAILRPSESVLFIPPIHFGEGVDDPDAHAESFSTSLHRSFADLWDEPEVRALSQMVAEGIRDAVRD